MAWQPFFRDGENIWWKDFRYSVCKTHTWFEEWETCYQTIGSFEAWMDNDNSHEIERVKYLYDEYRTWPKLKWVKHGEWYDSGYYKCRHCKLMGTKRTFKEYNCMSVMNTDKNKEKEKKEPRPKLQVYSGGKDGEGDWLSGLSKGSVFTCLPNKDPQDYTLAQFHVMNRWGRNSVYLMSNFPMHQQGEFLFHSTRFSQLHTLVDILQEGPGETLEEESTPGQINPSGLETD